MKPLETAEAMTARMVRDRPVGLSPLLPADYIRERDGIIVAELREAIYESDNGDGSGRLHALLVSLGGVAREDGNS